MQERYSLKTLINSMDLTFNLPISIFDQRIKSDLNHTVDSARIAAHFAEYRNTTVLTYIKIEIGFKL